MYSFITLPSSENRSSSDIEFTDPRANIPLNHVPLNDSQQTKLYVGPKIQ